MEILKRGDIGVLVTDHRMPGMTGIELLAQARSIAPDTVKIMMTAHADLETALAAINAGEVFRFIIKPWDDKVLIQAVEEGIQHYRLIQSLKRSDESHLLSLAQAIELKDPYTRGHCDRVAHYALLIARALNLPPENMNQIRHGSWLHDCGKIGIPEQILNKPGALDADEMEIVKRHPEMGMQVAKVAHASDILQNIIYYHHEKYDGTGYPRGKKGLDIPLEARIVAVADIYDALTTDRPYRPAFSSARAIEMLKSMRGAALDPAILDCFIALLKKTSRVSDEAPHV
jgi:putative nucleotidyltransferase with HDIG domain